MEQEAILAELKKHFPSLWQFIVAMVYCRTAYQSLLKNIPFHLSQSAIPDLIGWKEKLIGQKISDTLFQLGSKTKPIHDFIKPMVTIKLKLY